VTRRLAGAATALVCGILACAVAAAPSVAQDLDGVERRIVDGRTAEAREVLLAWWDREWDAAGRDARERALWLRGRLTLDPAEAAASYRRMVTEYPVGRFTERALHRLGSLAATVGDTLATGRWFAVLERDFPGSEGAREAAAWLAAHPGAVDRAGERPRPATASRGDASTASASGARGDWTIQLGAFAARSRAEGFAEDIREAGFTARVVRAAGNELWRVRVGRFADDEDARALYDRIRGAGFEAAIVPGADTERSGG